MFFSLGASGDACFNYQLSIYNIIIIMLIQTVFFLFLFLFCTLACPQNCLFCLTEPSCSACKTTYALTKDANCLSQTISNCRILVNATFCSICEPTFMVSSGQCVKDYSGCVIRNSAGICQYCWFGTQLKEGTCIGIMNCQTYQGTKCLKCNNGYSLSGGSCVQNRQECTAKSNGFCTKCASLYNLNGFSCLPSIALPPYCSLFDLTVGRCLICYQGYEIYHKFCQRKDYIPFYNSGSTAASNALYMQQDVLGSTVVNNPVVTKSDAIIQDYVDIEIKTSVGFGQKTNSQNCWQRDQGGNCVLCNQGYTLINQTCAKAPPLCLQFDATGKICTQCRPQLVLSNGNCLDNNCAVPIFSRCTKCLNNFSPNSQGICINSNCINFSKGNCTQCASGYSLSSNNLCTKSTTTTTSNSTSQGSNQSNQQNTTIIGCDLAVNGACVRCSSNFYPNNNGGCKKVIIGCQQYDKAELNCIQCISIYTKTSDGGCVYEPQVSSSQNNPSVQTNTTQSINTSASQVTQNSSSITKEDNCLVKNNGSCAICKARFIMNIYNFSCIAIPKECLTYDSTNGNCLSCASGYNLFQIWCLPKLTQIDPNCIVKDINNYCTNCQSQYYQNQGRCYPINSQCKTVNMVGGDCLSCYSGYIIYNGDCVQVSQQPSCIQYDFQSRCTKCAQRYFLQDYVCIPISPLCNNYNTSTGICIDCITGYGMSSITGKCEIIKNVIAYCQTADPVGNCLTCMSRYYFNSSNACVPINPLCSNYVANGGKCLSCFPGYTILSDNSCVKTNSSTGCSSASTFGLCTACSNQYVLTSTGNCNYKDPNCLNYDEKGLCSKCVSLYYLQTGKCIKQTLKAADPNCLINDLMNYCLGCTAGYYIFAGNCILADQLCRTFDPSNGHCLTCYSGYRLYQDKCFLDNPIFNCKQFSGSNCVVCETGYTLKNDGSCSQN